jgi:hypothetical protein
MHLLRMPLRMMRWALGVLCIPAMLEAQPQASIPTLSLSGFTGQFDAVTSAVLDVGYQTAATPIVVSLASTGGNPNDTRTVTVTLRGQEATLGAGKPIGHLEFLSSAIGVYRTVGLLDQDVVPPFSFRRSNPYSGTVLLRIRTEWTDTPPATYGATLIWTLTVSAP